MAVRASLLPYFVGLLGSGLVLGGCPGDDTGADGGGSGSGSTTQTPDDSTGPNPVTDDGTTANPPDGTATDGPTDTGDSTGTTGEPPVECPYEPVEGMPGITLELVGSGFDRPILAVGHPTELDRLFVVEQGGDVRILEPGQTTAPATAFLTVDVRGANNNTIGPEYGLLGFAFHPDFPTDPRVYVNYNPPTNGGAMHTIVSEFTVDPANPDAVDPTSERIILDIYQPADNHNGGMITFGDDGYLYVGFGDGGGGGDTFDTGRNTGVLLAKVIRIGVEPDGTPDDPQSCEGCPTYGPFDYTIPADNPFVGDAGFAPEIFAWGVRNPWRFAQDPGSSVWYMGDVGQNNFEEVSLIESGHDYGWSDMEGFNCHGGASCEVVDQPNAVNGDGMTMPLVEYGHSAGRCSVTGLSVYHSCEVPAWDGVYFYSDFCSGEVFGMVWDGSTLTDLGQLLDHNEFITGNGWNGYGDVLVTTVDATFGLPIEDGLVYRIAPAK